jgi:hypothetical protein
MRPQPTRWRGRNPIAAFVALRGLRPLVLEGRRMMLDAIYLAIGIAFLGAAVLYVVVCDRL